MKKKLFIFSVITVFMLVAISFATAVSTEKMIEKKESPLFGIRTGKAINREKINEMKESIKARFIRQRVFFLPITLKIIQKNLGEIFYSCTDCPGITCQETFCWGGGCSSDVACTSAKTCDSPTSSYTCPGTGITCGILC